MTPEPNIPAILCLDVAFLLGYVSWALWQLENSDQEDDDPEVGALDLPTELPNR